MSKSILQKKRILTKAGGGSSLATPVSVANGGTNISSYAVGDIIYASGTTTLSKLAIGTANQQLRVNAGATALEYFTPASVGLIIGTTTSSGTNGRLIYQAGGVVQQQANFSIDLVATGYLDVPSGYAQGGSFIMKQSANSLWIGSATGRTTVAQTNSTILGVGAHPQNGGTGYNTCVGYNSNAAATGGGWGNSLVGAISMASGTTATLNSGIGLNCLKDITTGRGNIGIGAQTFTGTNVNNSLAFGDGASPSVDNEIVFGSTSYAGGDYQSRYTAMYVGSGKNSATPVSFTICGTGGLGSNINGSNLVFCAGLPTGDGSSTATGRNGYISWLTGDVGVSGTTLRSATEKARLVQGGDLVLGITSDTKGLIQKSPNGHYWRQTISDIGVTTWTDLGTTIPT